MGNAGRLLCLGAFLALCNGFLAGWSLGSVLSALLTALALVLVRDGMGPRPHLVAAASLAWMFWGLSYLSNLIEAVAFRIVSVSNATKSLIVGLLVAIAAAALLEVLTPAPESGAAPTRIAAGAFWRFPLLALVFLVTYLAAGIAVQPWIMSFYKGRFLPSMPQLTSLVFCRGLLDTACVYPWLRLWDDTRSRAALVSAYVFAGLCGWAPLLLPNRYLPVPIRWAHAVEMGASGMVFGAIAALLLLRSSKPTQGLLPVEQDPRRAPTLQGD